MAPVTGRIDTAVVELVEMGGVDARRESQRVTQKAVFELCNQVVLPVEAMDLPGAETEGNDRYGR
jgi:hypothetical protein